MEHYSDDRSRIMMPMSLSFFGEGAPEGSNPGRMAQSRLSQTLAYLCRAEEKTAADLAGATGVPAVYLEEELERQCGGANGQYGLLRRTEQGKYIANIIIAEGEEYVAVNTLYRKYALTFCDLLAEAVAAGREELCAFRQRNLHRDTGQELLLWALLPELIGSFVGQVGAGLKRIFSDVTPSGRPYTALAVADIPAQRLFYDCDSIVGHHICGYSDILVRNLHGDRLSAHFRCGHDLAADSLLNLTIRCAGGLPLFVLNRKDREIAQKAVSQGYLREREGVLEPAILVLADGISVYIEFQNLLGALERKGREAARRLAGELGIWMREYIPRHLLEDYPHYNSCIASHYFFHDVVEECIRRGILNAPKRTPGPEGVLMVLCV